MAQKIGIVFVFALASTALSLISTATAQEPPRLTEDPADDFAVFNVVDVSPSPLSVYVDDREVGVAPGHAELPSDRTVTVRLEAPGHESWESELEVAAGEMETVRGIQLQPRPTQLSLTANVHGAEIVVDGEVLGTTRLNRSTEVEAPSGKHTVAVRMEGYWTHTEKRTLTPGGRSTMAVELVARGDLSERNYMEIPAGTFTQGSPESEEGRWSDEDRLELRWSDEGPQREVEITRSFLLKETPVTQGEWEELMGNNPSRFSSCGEDCPVEWVNWWDAVAYVNALSEEVGLEKCYEMSGCTGTPGDGEYECSSVSFEGLSCEGYRLPTEAEWEYAARAGTTGARYGSLDDIAWHRGNSNDSPHPVRGKRPNDWGLYDMIGNVFEWTNDWHSSPYEAGRQVDPMGPKPGPFTRRVVRGCSWDSHTVADTFIHIDGDGARTVVRELAPYCRAAYRRSITPDFRRRNVGLRPARSLISTATAQEPSQAIEDPADDFAVLNVVDVSPSPLSIYADDREVGVAPGRAEIPSDRRVTVRLEAPGHKSWETELEVAAGELETVRGIQLQPRPTQLSVTANMNGAAIVVDGEVVGSTRLNRPTEVEAPSGEHTVVVRIEGYRTHSEERTLTPGGQAQMEVELLAEVDLSERNYVEIPAGTFTQGSPQSEEGRLNREGPQREGPQREGPQREVEITRSFLLKETPVTQGEWEELMGNNPSRFSSCGEDCPVEQVNWWDAVAYVNALSEEVGLEKCYEMSGCTGTPGDGEYECSSVSFEGLSCEGYRLPTEAEWEYAARAGTTGARYGSLDAIVWHRRNSDRNTQPVRVKRANDWGLYDMIGNVWEWTNDWYSSPYEAGRQMDPMGPESGSSRVLRGCGWNSLARNCRAAFRFSAGPGYRNRDVGLRPARSL